MNCYEYIKNCAEKGIEPNDIDGLISLAYWIGRESATKQVADRYCDRIKKMREFASKQKYHHLCNAVIDSANMVMGKHMGDYVYQPDYAGDVTNEFGHDPLPEQIKALL